MDKIKTLKTIFIVIVAFELISCKDSDVAPDKRYKLESETRFFYRTSTEDTVITELSYEYDSIGRVKRQGTTTFTYFGDTLIIEDIEGLKVEHRFKNGNIVSVTGGWRDDNWFEYDNQGNLVKRISPNYRGDLTEYSITMENGNIVKMEWMDNDVYKTVQDLYYDQGQNPKKGMVTELFGSSWRNYFNTNNWILNIVEEQPFSADSSFVSNQYDEAGNLIERVWDSDYWETYRYLSE